MEIEPNSKALGDLKPFGLPTIRPCIPPVPWNMSRSTLLSVTSAWVASLPTRSTAVLIRSPAKTKT